MSLAAWTVALAAGCGPPGDEGTGPREDGRGADGDTDGNVEGGEAADADGPVDELGAEGPDADADADATGTDAADADGGADGDAGEAEAEGADVPGAEDAPHVYDYVCDEMDFPIHHEIVRLMLLLDQSPSMIGSSWSDATDALRALLTDPAFEDMYFGLDAFPDGYPGAWSDCGFLCLRCSADECGTLFPPQVPVDIAARSRDAIIAHMDDSSYPQFCGFTPLVNQLEYYDSGPGPTDAPEMYSTEGDSYLVVVSDGQDEGCFSGDPVAALAEHTRNILADHGIRSFAIGITDVTVGELADELNAIASSGGTAFTSFLPADDGPALAAALESIASSVITCVYVLDALDPTADPELVNFYLPDGSVIPMDEDCTETTGAGWHWTDATHTAVEFCGDYCTRIKSGEITGITATFGCSTIVY